MSKSPSTKSLPASDGRSLKKNSVGVTAIVFFVMSAQAPLTGIAGAAPLAIGLGNGAGAPLAYLVVGIAIALFAVGFIAMSRSVDKPGAFYAYVSAAFGRAAGGAAAWVALLSYVSIQAAMYGLYGAALAGLVSGLTAVAIPWWAYSAATALLVLALGLRGIELGARVLITLVVAEFAILLLFAFTVLFTGGGPEGLNPAASFSPEVLFAGSAGVAIMFAVASMFGFEATAIYSAEAKNPARTVARAAYISVAIVAVFFAFVTWMLVAWYGATNVVDAAFAALESGDGTMFLFTPMATMFGDWIVVVGGVLLITSLLAGIIAFHNHTSRYLHALASDDSLPVILSSVNRHHAPVTAAITQTVIALAILIVFAAAGLDPVLGLFTWFSGLGVLALLTVYIATSFAVIAYFHSSSSKGSRRDWWSTLISPVIALLLIGVILALVLLNFPDLIGGDWSIGIFLVALVPLAAVGGAVSARIFSSRARS